MIGTDWYDVSIENTLCDNFLVRQNGRHLEIFNTDDEFVISDPKNILILQEDGE